MYQQFYQGSDLLIWPLVGLGIFVVAFVGVLVWVLFGLRRSPLVDHLAHLPLEDDVAARPQEEASSDE